MLKILQSKKGWEPGMRGDRRNAGGGLALPQVLTLSSFSPPPPQLSPQLKFL